MALLCAFSGLSQHSLALRFYRSPHSNFVSGEASLAKLSKNIKGSEFIFDYLIENQQRKRWVSADKLARDLDLSRQVLFKNQEYTLLELRGYWALLERPQSPSEDQKKIWAPQMELTSAPTDAGWAMTLIATSLRSRPLWSSPALLQIPGKSKMQIVSMDETWLQVRYQSQTGYVDLNNLLMKADFASEAMDLQGKWHKVKYREGPKLWLENNKILKLTQVSQWRTQNKKAIVTETSESEDLLLRQNFNIEKIQAQVWTISEISGHGKIFWRRSDLLEKDSAKVILSAEQLLRREIFSLAFDPKNPALGLLSSHGIYLTKDAGETWELLPQFKNENHPVTIAPDGSLVVGFMKSRDAGKSFNQYLRTDFLARLIQSQTHGPPKILRLAEVGFSHAQMRIRVDTGVKSLRLATRSKQDVITDWDFLD